MIRQKVYQLEQAQIKMKQEYVHLSCRQTLKCTLIFSSFYPSATKPRSVFCATSWSREAFRLCRPILEVPRSMPVLPRPLPRHWVTGPATCSAASWPIPELAVPVLPPLPLRISSLLSMLYNSPPLELSRAPRSQRRARSDRFSREPP